MSLTGEQMHRMTTFAVALSKLKRAADAGQGVDLDPDECVALVETVRTLAAKPEWDAIDAADRAGGEAVTND
jgi:hypothetical protein